LHCGLPQFPLPHSLQVSVAALPQMAHKPVMFMPIAQGLEGYI